MHRRSKPTDACLILHKKSANRPEVRQAIDFCKQQGVDLKVRIPWRGKDRREFIDQAIKTGTSRIIAGGGDGTLNKVVNVLMKKDRSRKVSLGIMPLGTANDFAYGASIPRDDLNAALLLAATGDPTPIDVGKANDRFFLNVASGGFGAEVTATTPQKLKAALGGAAYTLAGLAKALKLQPSNCRIHMDGGAVEEVSMVAMAVGNNRFAGGGFEVAPKADMRDGLLDFSVLTADSIPNAAKLAAQLSDPMAASDKLLRHHQAKSISIESGRPLHMNLDGEPFIEKRFDFDTIRQGLSVVLGTPVESRSD
jgi:lipid kinase YegS